MPPCFRRTSGVSIIDERASPPRLLSPSPTPLAMRIAVALLLLIPVSCLLPTLHAGQIDTIAGDGKPTGVGQPFGVEIGPDGALYICEVQNHRVRRLNLK